ncbi:MAG: gliding motility-associated C-terminal domain-containing protein [Bacteroidales bacterium]|nr:gliding motility-associated C-terminal domain-containing protein [Bacteroidales bacterium]
MKARTVRVIILFVSCLILLPFPVHPEGTKQLIPSFSACGQLCIDKARNDFAFYDGAADYRLNIAIANTSETIRFGFGSVISVDHGNPTELNFRIKDPAGNVVYGHSVVPAYGPGYISTYEQSVAGPFPGAGGYDYLELDPSATGDYSLEFIYLPYDAFSGYTHEDKHMLQYFDITVLDAAGEVTEGRVWSKAWQFWSENPDVTTSRFYGKMMILSDDSIVTQLDCNGFQGGTFSIYSNQTGCASTGNFIYDRKSREGFFTYPQYKLFLNDPDSLLFPTARISPGIIGSPTFTPDCATGGGSIGLAVKKSGTVRILVETNPSPGIDPEDSEIVASVTAGDNLVAWDGYNSSGLPVPNGSALTITITFIRGLSHLPLYDIENNDDGLIIQQIRPSGGELQIFWDDSGIDGNYNVSSGCESMAGCHKWTKYIGDNNTVNSWWYIKMDDIAPVYATSRRTPGMLAITGSEIHCTGTGVQEYSVTADPSSSEYQWAYSGTGVTIIGSGTKVALDFSSDATSGTLSVLGHNEPCGDGSASLAFITVTPLPDVSLADFTDVCYTAPGFLLEGGQPAGGTYYVDGIRSDSLFPYKESGGMHRIVYTYTAPTGCMGSDTAEILLSEGSDCEGFLLFPNAFTPNGDGSNDVFKPAIMQNIYRSRMEIYNRWGLFIFSTEDITRGWDGTCNGQECPGGAYLYVVTYGFSLRTNETGKIKGILTLLR